MAPQTRMKSSKLWFSGLLLWAFLSACSGQGNALSNQSSTPITPAISEASPTAIASKSRITFTGQNPPPWAQEAESIMTELEQWRGKQFKQNLVIHIKPREEGEPAGWYNPTTKQLVVTDNGSNEFKRGVMLHEIFHALQDQTFDLTQLHQSAVNPDADQAIDALIEGEAMLAVSDLMNYNFAAHAKLPAEGNISDDLFNRLFEYGNGMQFVSHLREKGGWEQVDTVFLNPPKSTREIFHPEKYPSTSREQFSQTGIGEYGFQLWLARDPETRSQLKVLQGAYESDTLNVTDNGLHTWTINLDSEKSAQLVQELAPKAIAQMPNSPKSYKLEQKKTQLRIQWQR